MGDKVAVASTVYNLAGPESRRPDFLKSLIIGGIMQGADSLGEVIATGYRNGPAPRFKRFGNWTKQNEEFQRVIGITEGTLTVQQDIDLVALKGALPKPNGTEIRLDFAKIDAADYLFWAKQFVAQNYPDRLIEPWTADCEYNEETGEAWITIDWNGGVDPADLETPFLAQDFDPEEGRYLYVGYTATVPEVAGSVTTGQKFSLGAGPWPDVTGWDQNSYQVTEKSVELNITEQVETTYSDGRHYVTSSTRKETQSYQQITAVYEQTEYKGESDTDNSLYSIRTIRNLFQDGRVFPNQVTEWTDVTTENGVTKTVKTKRTFDNLLVTRELRDDTQRITHNAWGPQQFFIYKESSGNATLDAFFAQEAAAGSFLPPIPFRWKNKEISDKASSWKVKLPAEVLEWEEPGFPPTREALQIGNVLFFSKDAAGKEVTRAVVAVLDDGNGYSIIHGLNSDYNRYQVSKFLDKARVLYVARSTTDNTIGAPIEPWLRVEEWTQIPASSGDISEYELCKKAFKKAYAGDYDEVLENINSNESIDDIDYAYAAFGVSLNVEERACRKYLYKFFTYLKDQDPSSRAREDLFWRQFNAAYLSQQDYNNWRSRQDNPGQFYSKPPSRLDYPTLPWKEINIRAVHDGVTNWRTRLKWAFIHEESGSGLLKEGVKKGELWFEILNDPIEDPKDGIHFGGSPVYLSQEFREVNNRVALCWQDSENSWRRLVITGLLFRNIIYKEKNVTITAKEALKHMDSTHPDYEESGFLVPLHEDVYFSMSMVDRTQMGTACCFLVFNSYVVRKERWYETTLFKIILFVAVIIISVTITVLTGGAGIGIFGAAAEVGGALGLTGTAALIAGATINTLAGLIVGFVITKASVEIFGEKWGGLIGAILSFAFTFGTINIAQGGASVWDLFSTADGLIALSSAVSQGVATTLNAFLKEAAEDFKEDYEEKAKEIRRVQKLLEKDFSKLRPVDPLYASQYISELTEKPEQFLSRTLMTGSDIVDLNLSFLHKFADYTLKLELP